MRGLAAALCGPGEREVTMPKTEWGWRATPEELAGWVIDDSEDILAVNKPAHLVCHPTKQGPWSSLSSAVREGFGLDPIHLISRLDRETSGVVLIGRTREAAALFRVQGHRNRPVDIESLMRKTYLAVLAGELREPVTVLQPLALSESGEFRNKQEVNLERGQACETVFEPLAVHGGYTLAAVQPKTGRMHQIRVHAAWLGTPVAGDKLYPDESLQLAFLRDGWGPALAERLPLDRQALHAWRITVHGRSWEAPLPEDLRTFISSVGLPVSPQIPSSSL